MPSLNPRQFFHGTTQKFEPGDVLRPSTETGVRVHSPEHTPDDEYGEDSTRVFSTADERDAWAFAVSARAASNETFTVGSPAGMSLHRRPTKRPYVYEVEPEGSVRSREQEGMPNTQSETLSDTARVVRRIDAPPPGGSLFDDEQIPAPGVQPALPSDDPSFSHGFMGDFEAQNHGFTRETLGVEDEFAESRNYLTRLQAERSFRRDNQDLAREGAGRFQPEMFDSDQYADPGYLEDRRYRTHW